VSHLILLDAAGTSQRRLLQEERARLEKLGYEPGGTVREGTSWSDLLASGSTRGLFCSKTYLLVEGAEKLGKFPESLLPELTSSPGDAVFLLLYAKSWGSFFPASAKDLCTVRKGEVMPRWGRERMEWLRKNASSAGVELSSEALSFISERFEDPEEIRGEFRKLALAYYDRPLSGKEVAALSVDEGEKALLHFLDGLCYRRVSETLEAFRSLARRQPFLLVLTSLYNRIRVGMYMALYPSRKDQEEALKSIGARSYQKRMGQELLRRYPKRALYDFAVCLAFLSAAEKAGVGPGWRGLEMGLLQLLGASVREEERSRERR
jgi:DNA polymerase III delta subunit